MWENNKRLYLLDDLVLVVTGGNVVEVDNLLDLAQHVADELELDIRLKKSTSDLIQAFVQNLLVDDDCIAHLLKSTRYAPS